MLLLAVFFSSVAVAATLPTPEHRYWSGDQEVTRLNHSEPIRFNGIAIGTTELNSTGIPGAIHSLQDGHHFFHKDWVLTDTNGGSWEYLPDIRRRGVEKRQSGEPDFIVFQGFSGYTIYNVFFSGSNRQEPTDFEIPTSLIAGSALMAWSWRIEPNSGFEVMDLFDDDSIFASTSSLIGDLTDIFMNALELF